MPYQTAAVANSFLDIAESKGELTDQMKLQKLVYFAHGWHLGFGEGALNVAEAWRWGPVFPDLYRAMRRWGAGKIKDRARAAEMHGKRIRISIPSIPSADAFAIRLIERVWDVYGGMSGPALSQLTHEPGGPWDVIRKKNPGARNQVIPNRLIQEHFKQKIQADVEQKNTR